MKKRCLTSIILLMVLCLPLFAGVKRITAYKQDYTADYIPDSQLSVRFLSNDSEELQLTGEQVSLDDNARSNSSGMLAFSWILSGNILTNVNLSFTLYPMKNVNDSTKVIPYTLTLIHDKSRIGNTTILCNQVPTYSAGGTFSFPSNVDSQYTGSVLRMMYADSTKYGSSVGSTSVEIKFESTDTSSKSQIVSYNMSTNSRQVSQNNSLSEINLSSYPFASNGTKVCEFWNRYGQAYINLNIDKEDPIHVDHVSSGLYRAQVQVEITTT